MLEPEETQNLLEAAPDRMGLQSEPVIIRSGQLLMIDQFMLGNAQFFEGIEKGAAVPPLSQDFGGLVIEMIPGTWKVYRFARERSFLLCPESVSEEEVLATADQVAAGAGGKDILGKVYIETRCVVFLDAELLGDGKIISEFSRLRRTGKDKEARDFLRESGAAVRYGFDQNFDELKVGVISPSGFIALTPVVSDHGSEGPEIPLP